MIVCEGTEILPEHLRRACARAPPATSVAAAAGPLITLDEMERSHIERALKATGGHRGQAASCWGSASETSIGSCGRMGGCGVGGEIGMAVRFARRERRPARLRPTSSGRRIAAGSPARHLGLVVVRRASGEGTRCAGSTSPLYAHAEHAHRRARRSTSRPEVYVVGHTDNVASLDPNTKLSQTRAEAVVQTLVGKHGIAAARLSPEAPARWPRSPAMTPREGTCEESPRGTGET